MFFESNDYLKDNPDKFNDYYEKITEINDELPYEFRERLRYLREEFGFTREDLESRTYIHVQTIKQIETKNDRGYTLETIVALCIGMELPPTLSFGLIRAAGFNLESDFSKKSLLYNFVLFNFYKDGIDRVNEYLLSCGFSPLNKRSY